MISEKIKSVHAALGELNGRLRGGDDEARTILAMARMNLKACAEDVQTLETHFVPVGSGEQGQEAGHGEIYAN